MNTRERAEAWLEQTNGFHKHNGIGAETIIRDLLAECNELEDRVEYYGVLIDSTSVGLNEKITELKAKNERLEKENKHSKDALNIALRDNPDMGDYSKSAMNFHDAWQESIRNTAEEILLLIDEIIIPEGYNALEHEENILDAIRAKYVAKED